MRVFKNLREPDKRLPAILESVTVTVLATSTFEWVPGVTLHHSRDLVNWQLPLHHRGFDPSFPFGGIVLQK